MNEYAPPITQLIDRLAKMPGVGRKSAHRMAYYLLDAPMSECEKLVASILEAKEKIHCCSICQGFTDTDPCAICESHKRLDSVVCVVQSPRDVIAMEKTNEFRGKYHVLHGAISPMDGIGPDDLKIKELLHRVSGGLIEEVILATASTVEGEATAMYISKLLKPLGVKVTRIAHGLPVGGDIEYADEITLARALSGRQEL